MKCIIISPVNPNRRSIPICVSLECRTERIGCKPPLFFLRLLGVLFPRNGRTRRTDDGIGTREEDVLISLAPLPPPSGKVSQTCAAKGRERGVGISRIRSTRTNGRTDWTFPGTEKREWGEHATRQQRQRELLRAHDAGRSALIARPTGPAAAAFSVCVRSEERLRPSRELRRRRRFGFLLGTAKTDGGEDGGGGGGDATSPSSVSPARR